MVCTAVSTQPDNPIGKARPTLLGLSQGARSETAGSFRITITSLDTLPPTATRADVIDRTKAVTNV